MRATENASRYWKAFSIRAELAIAAACNLAVVIHSEEQLRMLDSAPADARLDVLLKVNTGMNRLGFMPSAAGAALERLKMHRAVQQLTLMTHFATADDARGVDGQMAIFDGVAAGHAYERSLANSAAILRYPQTHADWVRPGIMLYGCTPFADVSADRTRSQAGDDPHERNHSDAGPRIRETASVTRQRLWPPSRMRVGIVACGYADGYPRHAPTGTPVLVNARRAHYIGTRVDGHVRASISAHVPMRASAVA